MQLVKQSTTTTIYVGPVLDSAGAAVTSAVLADFRIVKNGTAATLTGATVTHDANGYYTIALTTGNTDTLGRLTIAVGNTAMSMSTHRYSVLPATVFDALIANATNVSGGLLAATGSNAWSGAVGSVTNRVTANTDQLAGQTVTAAAGVTFPTSVASPTNITAGTITTVTNLTNAPTSGDLTATMKASVTTAATSSTPTVTLADGAITAAKIGADAITAAKVASDVSTEIATAILAAGDVDGYTLEQTLKLCLAALAGKISGAGTTTVTIRAADDSKARITATVDSSGNRSSITYDVTG